jgi:NADH-quinone oxidoreductase subunit M
VFLGTLPDKWKGLTDMNLREGLMLVPLAAIVIVLGIYPSPILDLMNSSINQLATVLQHASTAAMLGLN